MSQQETFDVAGTLDAARSAFEAGRFEDAALLLEPFVQRHPEVRAAHDLLGRTRFEQGRYDDAKVHFERAITLDDSEAMAHLWMGKVLAEEIHRAMIFAKLPLAKKLFAGFTRAAEIDPESVPAQTALARFHLEAPAMAGGSPDKLRVHMDRLYQLDAAAAHRMEARVFIRDGDFASAERELRLAVEADAEEGESHLDLGALLLSDGQVEEALVHLLEAVRRSPDQHLAHFKLGEACLRAEPPRLSRARQAFTTYLQRHPTHDLPSQGEAWMQLGQVEERSGDVEKARHAYSRALEANPRLEAASEALERLGGR